jgi:hypothetical protein
MAKKKASHVQASETVRSCANIRSKKHPDVRCTYAAAHGEFCARHHKNPTRFQEKSSLEHVKSKTQILAIQDIQRWWRLHVGLLRFSRQGPSTNIPSVSENQTDIFTLESTHAIPLIYRWSYADSKKHIWLFDVRSLSMTRAQDSRETLLNPYTREAFPEKDESHFQNRCSWLRARKYCLVHSQDAELTIEQLWHQQILDVTLKYDMLGYHTCIHWFEELNTRQLMAFYIELWELWFYRLHLDSGIKHQVIPNWNSRTAPLFKWSPSELLNRVERRWWQKVVLDLLNRFVSSAVLKEHRVLGALYGMTGFAIVSQTVREQYPWLVEIQGDF